MAAADPARPTFEVSRDRMRAFEQGYVFGQTVIYCEQLKAGAKLAAQISCAKELVHIVTEVADGDGVRHITECGDERASVWLFVRPMAGQVIAALLRRNENTPPAPLEVWQMGKLFGYADADIEAFIDRHLG